MTIHRDMWKEYEREEKEDGSEPKKSSVTSPRSKRFARMST